MEEVILNEWNYTLRNIPHDDSHDEKLARRYNYVLIIIPDYLLLRMAANKQMVKKMRI